MEAREFLKHLIPLFTSRARKPVLLASIVLPLIFVTSGIIEEESATSFAFLTISVCSLCFILRRIGRLLLLLLQPSTDASDRARKMAIVAQSILV